MLQQTTVQAVKAYFENFVALLADGGGAGRSPARRRAEGLGGARLLCPRPQPSCLRAGRCVPRFGGRFPQTEEELAQLPGIGPYTAGAIAAIAFGGRHAAVDGNVERVISRLLCHRDAASRFEARNPREGAGAGAGAPRRRLRPGDDGPRRHHLHPARAQLPHLSVAEHCEGRISGLAPRCRARSRRRRCPRAAAPPSGSSARMARCCCGAGPRKGLLGGMMEVPSTDWGEEP